MVRAPFMVWKIRMADDFAANFPPLVSREQAGDAIAKALNLFVGRGRRYTVKELANATGVKDRMIECARLYADNIDHRPLPDWALLSIMRFLGPGFTTTALAPADQVASYAGDTNHDTLAAEALSYGLEHARARHPDSPGGVNITRAENEALDVSADRLRAVS